jgi:hypothetical protein
MTSADAFQTVGFTSKVLVNFVMAFFGTVPLRGMSLLVFWRRGVG